MYRLIANTSSQEKLQWYATEESSIRTSQDVVNILGLDTWVAKKFPNHMETGTEVPSSFMIRRLNNNPETEYHNHVLEKLVNDKYEVLQYPKGLAWADSFLMEGLLTVNSVFYVEPGSSICLTMESGIDAEVVPGDTVRRFLILNLTHTKTKGLIGWTDICPVCCNTLAMAREQSLAKAGKGLELDPNKPEKSLEFAKRMLNVIEQRFYEKDIMQYRAYSNLELEPQQQEHIIKTIINAPLDKQVHEYSEGISTHYLGIKKALAESPGQELRQELTGYHLLSAVSWYSKEIGFSNFEKYRNEHYGTGKRFRKQTMEMLNTLLPDSAIPVGV